MARHPQAYDQKDRLSGSGVRVPGSATESPRNSEPETWNPEPLGQARSDEPAEQGVRRIGFR
jgi:hypothetical protein